MRLERRSPLLIPAAGLIVALVLLALAAGAPGELSEAPLSGGRATVAILAEAPPGTSPRVQAVALGTIASALRADPAVASVRSAAARGSADLIEIQLTSGDAAAAQTTIARLERSIDPGPLRLRFAAAPLVLDAARSSVQADLPRLELLVAPFALLVLIGVAGLRAGGLGALAAVISLAGALVALRLTGGELIGFAPAAAIGLTGAIELAALLSSLEREEALVAPSGAPLRARMRWMRPAATATGVRLAAALAVLATPFGGAGSMAIASVAAVILAFGAIAGLGPAFLSLGELDVPTGGGVEGRLNRAVRALPRVLARSRRALAAVVALALLAALALAFPAHDASTSPIAAGDLPAGGAVRTADAAVSAARSAPAATVLPPAGASLRGVIGGAAIAALALAAGLTSARSRRSALRIAATAPLSLAPAAAGLGLLAFGVQHGHLAALAGSRTALVEGSAAASLMALAVISCGRSALAASVASAEGRTGAGPIDGAELAVGTTLPGAVGSTLVAGAAFAALAGADLDAAREIGLGIAAGLVVDLVLLRIPFLALLARLDARVSRLSE